MPISESRKVTISKNLLFSIRSPQTIRVIDASAGYVGPSRFDLNRHYITSEDNGRLIIINSGQILLSLVQGLPNGFTFKVINLFDSLSNDPESYISGLSDSPIDPAFSNATVTQYDRTIGPGASTRLTLATAGIPRADGTLYQPQIGDVVMMYNAQDPSLAFVPVQNPLHIMVKSFSGNVLLGNYIGGGFEFPFTSPVVASHGEFVTMALKSSAEYTIQNSIVQSRMTLEFAIEYELFVNDSKIQVA